MRVVIGAVSIVALVFLALPVMALWTGVVLLIIAAVSLSLMRWLARVVGDADPMAEA